MRLLLALLLGVSAAAQEWREALGKMPVGVQKVRVHQTEPVELILKSFQPAGEMRAVVLMPAAADQLYFFDWGTVDLPANASLLDLLNVLSNKAELRFSFVAPFLLIRLERDATGDPLIMKKAPAKFEKRKKEGKIYYLDRPYDQILPAVRWVSGLTFTPNATSSDSWHFYRISFVGYDLSAADYLRAMAYGAKTWVTVDGKKALFKKREFQ